MAARLVERKQRERLVDVATLRLQWKDMMYMCCGMPREVMKTKWKVDQKWCRVSNLAVLGMILARNSSSQCDPRTTCLDVTPIPGVPAQELT